ncbi:unnamed protein product [Hymenolepis diminuta]|uniref:Fibronectin type-III domain-containing protein n=1 Tax=Hymenolepis diminuta TaxID=6216 RepID=A0A0R3SY10_HYMDI|nr:unnamed protein product [Hymenolepis diminuta]
MESYQDMKESRLLSNIRPNRSQLPETSCTWMSVGTLCIWIFYAAPDQPVMQIIAPTTLTLSWNTTIDPSSTFNLTLFVTNSIYTSDILSPDTHQKTYFELLPFTIHSATLAICNSLGCGPPSPKVYSLTWPDKPSPPLEVIVHPVSYNALEISWSPPANPNGNINGYVAFIPEPYRECTSSISYIRQCIIYDLPANASYKILVFACTSPNAENQGGGCGLPSDAVIASTWNGGLDLGLLEALVSRNFLYPPEDEILALTVPLFIPLSLIPLSQTGPLSNITLVIQEYEYYDASLENAVTLYPNYPFDNGKYHSNPRRGTYSEHDKYSGWELLIGIPELDEFTTSIYDVLVILGDGTGRPRNSYYFNGPLQAGTTYAVPPVNTVEFNGYLENLLSGPNDNLEIQFRREICFPAVFFDASFICSPHYEVFSGKANISPYGSRPDFIIASSPSIFTVGDFLFLLVRQRTTLVVMLDDITSIRRKTLALMVSEQKVITEVDHMTARYWPVEYEDSEDKPANLENFFSTYHACQVIRHSEQESKNWILRKLSVTPVDAMQVNPKHTL